MDRQRGLWVEDSCVGQSIRIAVIVNIHLDWTAYPKNVMFLLLEICV